MLHVQAAGIVPIVLLVDFLLLQRQAANFSPGGVFACVKRVYGV